MCVFDKVQNLVVLDIAILMLFNTVPHRLYILPTRVVPAALVSCHSQSYLYSHFYHSHHYLLPQLSYSYFLIRVPSFSYPCVCLSDKIVYLCKLR